MGLIEGMRVAHLEPFGAALQTLGRGDEEDVRADFDDALNLQLTHGQGALRDRNSEGGGGDRRDWKILDSCLSVVASEAENGFLPGQGDGADGEPAGFC